MTTSPRQYTPIKQPLRLVRRDLNLTNYSKPPETAKPEVSSPPASQQHSKRQKIETSQNVIQKLAETGSHEDVVIEEGPVVPDSGVGDYPEEDDLDDDEEDLHCMSAAQLLRKHRAVEFNEEEFDEDYY